MRRQLLRSVVFFRRTLDRIVQRLTSCFQQGPILRVLSMEVRGHCGHRRQLQFLRQLRGLLRLEPLLESGLVLPSMQP